MRRFGKVFAVVSLCSAIVPVVVVGAILAAFILLPLPAVLPEEHAFSETQVSHVYDIDGNEIAIFREFEQSIPVNPEDIPLHLKQAVISTEDKNFYNHRGVDVTASVRALVADIRGGGIQQGGSTITQQYVKSAIVTEPGAVPERSIFRKIREAVYATQLDRQYDKELILFKYLSSVYLGEGAYGVGAASETYFRKPVSQITISEAALLTGLIPAPSFYEPRGNPDGAESKRKLVLQRMLEQGFINQQQHDEAVGQPVWVLTQGKPPGPATVIHPPIKEFRKYPYFIDYVEKYLLAKYDEATVLKGGLRIQTSLDSKMQEAAEKTVAGALSGTRQPLEMAMASVEPPTGFVKALVGGRDFYSGDYANVNLALGKCPARSFVEKYEVQMAPACWDDPVARIASGGSGRQSGSAFKPFTLAAAFEKGIPPTKVYGAPGAYNIPNCQGSRCTIHNNEGAGGGSQSLRTATHKSTNTVYAQLAREVGVDNVAKMAQKLGLRSAWYAPDFHGSPTGGLSYTLGTHDTSPLEMAAAYSVFANRGQRLPVTPIVKIVDSTGKVLEDNTKREPERVLDEAIADNVTDVLRGVITSGTGTRANIGRPAAGKTGSTQNNGDAWFVGYTPTLSTGVWMGYADKPAPLRGIKGFNPVYGGTIPAATWKAFMSAALKDVPVTDFNEPAPIKAITDALRRRERNDFDPGPRRTVAETGEGGTYEYAPPKPKAQPPVTTSTTTPTAGPEDPGDDGGGGIIFP